MTFTRFSDLVHHNTDRIADPLAAWIKRFVELMLYARGKGVGDEKGELAADGFQESVLAWKKNSEVLHHRIKETIFLIEEET